MDRYTKAFIVASLVYFVLASLLGLWMGVGDPPAGAGFAHVHFNLLGFMAMMVYGVGYFVLPRFNARTLRWPSWLPVHFYIANLGLLGMVGAWMALGPAWFALFSGLSVLSVLMFAVNLGATLLTSAPEEAAGDVGHPAEEPTIGPDTRVGEILTRWPHTASVFAENGFPALGESAHREQVKQMPITVAMACARHGVEVERLLDLLTREIRGTQTQTGSDGPIGPDQVLGEILAAHPETEAVFRKYYGSGCFTCPGQATETVRQSAMIHNVDVRRLLHDLNRAVA